MCGIFFSISNGDPNLATASTKEFLSRRGPDHTSVYNKLFISNGIQYTISLHCSVLGLRGALTPQPLVDDSSLLCWNGEAYEIGNKPVIGSDTKAVYELLRQVSRSKEGKNCGSKTRSLPLLEAISHISGPYAMIYLDLETHCLWFGRDCLGRRSLLLHKDMSRGISLSSVIADDTSTSDWIEVEADGMYIADLTKAASGYKDVQFPLTYVPYVHQGLQLPRSPNLVSTTCSGYLKLLHNNDFSIDFALFKSKSS